MAMWQKLTSRSKQNSIIMTEPSPKTPAAEFTILTGEDIANAKKTPSKKKLEQVPWTEAEDAILTTLAQKGLRWKIVAACITSHNAANPIDGVAIERTSKQCVQRYTRVLHPNIRKGTWTPHEDALLKRGILDLGISSWAAVSRRIGTRTYIQCRTRWLLWRSQGKCPWMLSQVGAVQQDSPAEKLQRIHDDVDTETEVGPTISRKDSILNGDDEFFREHNSGVGSDDDPDADAEDVYGGAGREGDDFDEDSDTLSVVSKKTKESRPWSQNTPFYTSMGMTEGFFHALMKATEILMPPPIPLERDAHHKSDSAPLPSPGSVPSPERNGNTQAGQNASAHHVGASFKASLSFIMN